MDLTAVQQGIFDFDIIKVKCYVLSNGLHTIELNDVVKSIAGAGRYSKSLVFHKDNLAFPIISGADFIKCCKMFLKSQPSGTREYNIAEMFVKLTEHVSIDVFIWQACIPDQERIKVNFDEVISTLLNPPVKGK